LDPTDLLLPSLSEVRSTTLLTNPLGEFEVGLVGLLPFSVAVGKPWVGVGFCEGMSSGLERGIGEWDIVVSSSRQTSGAERQGQLPTGELVLCQPESRRITRYRSRFGTQRSAVKRATWGTPSRVCSRHPEKTCWVRAHSHIQASPPGVACLSIPLVSLILSLMRFKPYKLRGEICIGFATLFSYVLPLRPWSDDMPTLFSFAAVMLLIFVHVSFSLEIFSRFLSHLFLSPGWPN
jgi:hypothetical protein